MDDLSLPSAILDRPHGATGEFQADARRPDPCDGHAAEVARGRERVSARCHPERSEGPFAMSIKGPPRLTNEVQHQVKVLRWANIMTTLPWKSAARLPAFAKPANRSAKSRQLWIARHRASVAS